jgi:hypothetical protein
MSDYSFSLYARLSTESASPVALGRRYLETLREAARSAPQIGDWLIMPRPFAHDSLSFDEAARSIDQLVEDNVSIVDGEPDADNGYHLNARNRRDLSGSSLGLSANIGGKFDAKIEFEVGFTSIPTDLSVVSFPLFKTVLSIFIAHWPVLWANAELFRLGYDRVPPAPGIPPHPTSRYLIPWISYLSAPLSAGLEPPTEVETERMTDGGITMIASKDRLDPTNPEEMRKSRMMAEIMISRAGNP